MASVSAIHALTSGLMQHLSRAYQRRPLTGVTCKFEPVGVSDFKKLDGQDTKLTLLLYRITHNEHQRNRPTSTLPSGTPAALAVNLHLLVSIWADTALKEQSLLAWSMRELHQRPVLDRSLFAEVGAYGAGDLVSLTPEDLTLDDLSRLWQILAPPLRPSLGYVARNVLLDLDTESDHEPVIATRITLNDDVLAVAEGPS